MKRFVMMFAALLLMCYPLIVYADVPYYVFVPFEEKVSAFLWTVSRERLLYVALLTAAIETPLFYLWGYHHVRDCLCFALINIVSNILLNGYLLNISLHDRPVDAYFFGIIGLTELVAVVLEIALCCCLIPHAHRASTKELSIVVLGTNLVSLLCGVIWFLLLY